LHEFPVAQSKQVIGENDAYTMVKMMEGVIKSGTARRLNSYNIPTEKAGKTGTTQNNTDGWFIGYTPTLIAGTWVGCEDPFIPIYQNNAGGAEMAGPAWGNFMQKVYADKHFTYGEQKEFTAPAELKNDPIYADAQRFEDALQKGDKLVEDNGNGDASDFLAEDINDDMNDIAPVDTNNKPVKKEEKKLPATVPPPITDDKKTPPKPPAKPVNDY
jgi:penicillin-binding protein 1A